MINRSKVVSFLLADESMCKSSVLVFDIFFSLNFALVQLCATSCVIKFSSKHFLYAASVYINSIVFIALNENVLTKRELLC